MAASLPEPAVVAEPMTLEQWATLPEDVRGELVDGRLVEEEVPDVIHGLTLMWVGSEVRAWAAPRGGFVGSDGKLGVSDRRGRIPDLFAWLPGTPRPPRRARPPRTPPTLAVEVLSEGLSDQRRDRIEKMPEYAAFGIRYYWILDPWARMAEFYELTADGRYLRTAEGIGGKVEVPGFEGLVLDLDALWRELDAFDRGTEPEEGGSE